MTWNTQVRLAVSVFANWEVNSGAHSKGILQWSEKSHYHTLSWIFSGNRGVHSICTAEEDKTVFPYRHLQLHRLALVCSSFRRLNKHAGYCGKQDVVKVFSSLLSQVVLGKGAFFLAMLLCHSLQKGNAHSLLKGNALHIETWSPLIDMIKMACTLFYDNCFSPKWRIF